MTAIGRALFDLTGKTALVTGSSRGLGFAMAKGLAEAGARVVLNGVSAGHLAAAHAELRAAGHDSRAARFDVTDEAAVVAAFEGFERDGIAVDILINNAGINIRRPIVDMPTADWRRIIETNLTSAFVVGRDVAAADILRAAQGADRQLVSGVDVFDVYEGAGIPEDRKSVAIAVTLQPTDKTLTDAEIDAVAGKIVAEVARKTGATLR